MKCKVYLSDVGFGHLVRQRAIFDELTKIDPSLNVMVQTGTRPEVAKRMFFSAEFTERFNNIQWARKADGSPDLESIKHFFDDYESRSDEFIRQEEPQLNQFDFIISDFVYEAFYLAKKHKLPSFGVAHFTWDWFFSKMYPPPVSYDLIKRMQTYSKMSDMVYFPPFTPKEILAFYGDMATQVPFIVSKRTSEIEFPNSGKFTVLIMDSGADVLGEHFAVALQQIKDIEDIHFLVAEHYQIFSDNVTLIPETHFFSDYITHVDLVITRGGFNVISECIAYRTPILLLGEYCNPEIEQNLLIIKHEQLGSFLSLDRFSFSLKDSLRSFIDHEYKQIQAHMKNHEHEINGAEVIAHDILNRMA